MIAPPGVRLSHSSALTDMPTARHLQNVIESAIDFAIVVSDLNGVVTNWNAGAERVFGWKASEIIGKPAALFFTPEDRAAGRVETEMELSIRDGRAPDERWHLRKDQSRFFASGEMMPLRSDDGTHRGYVKIVRDRTAQHQADARLRQTEDRFRTLLDTMESAFAIVEVKFDEDDNPVDYRFLEANPGFEQQAGVNLRGKWVTEFAPDLEQFWFETYGAVAKNREPATFESYAEAFNRWFDVRAVPVGEPRDRQIAIFFTDSTQKREAVDRLKESEALARGYADRVQLALEAGAIIGTWVWDLREDRFTIDEPFARAFGIDSALGRDGLSLQQVVATVHPDDQQGLAAAINEVIARGGPYAHQYRVKSADGVYHWIEANGRVELNSEGVGVRFPGVLIDVDEGRAVKAERDRVAAALRELNATLEKRIEERTSELMRTEAQLRQAQKMEAVGQLTGGLAHDFNNLLAGVAGALELSGKRLAQGRFADVEKYHAAAQGAVQRAAALTHRLLAFSRRQTLDQKPTDVNALVDGMTDLIQRTIGPAVQLEVRARNGLWPALVDASQLENALLNLCINARDAMPDGGRITIATSNITIDERAAEAQDVSPGEYLTMSVSDTGTGMSPELVARVFEPFFTTKPIGEGTGLGLSMIYGFAKQSGGQVRIHSHVGQGTTVTLHLPRYEGQLAVEVTEKDAAQDHEARQGETVLVVDDEGTVRMLITDVMKELGYSVIEAADSLAALRLLQSGADIDLMISDVGLPGGMNGRQLADAARQTRPDLRVLFVTGYAEAAVIGSDTLPAGTRLLTKPFAIDALTARVHDLMQASKS